MNWHDGRQNRRGCLRYWYRSRRARYLGKGVKNNLSGGREQRCRCSFESIVVVVTKRAMVTKEIDMADAGHTVVRCAGGQNKKIQRTQR